MWNWSFTHIFILYVLVFHWSIFFLHLSCSQDSEGLQPVPGWVNTRTHPEQVVSQLQNWHRDEQAQICFCGQFRVTNCANLHVFFFTMADSPSTQKELENSTQTSWPNNWMSAGWVLLSLRLAQFLVSTVSQECLAQDVARSWLSTAGS